MIKLSLQDVTLGYGPSVVVEGITFQANPGQMLGLVGPNGCGKSTIIKALSHVIMPRLPSAFTAFEIVLMGRNPHLGLFQYEGRKDMDIAWQAMENTSIQNLSQRRISELSGGEIQSVVIARVLAQQTQAILLDEPTANLDINRQIEILDLIKGLCLSRGLTIVIALHDLNLAAQYCNRLVLIKGGKIYVEGRPEDVITHDNIRRVYGAGSYISRHPLSGLPVVLPVTGESSKEHVDSD
jgi:iron complex transport system ATP-binding protein